MDRAYAGILGSLVFAAMIARGIAVSQDPVVILRNALIGLVVFAFVGWMLGLMAAKTVDESVRNRFQRRLAELAEDDPADSPTP